MLFNTEGTEDTERVFYYRHRDDQEKPKGFAQSHAAIRNLQKLFLTERQVEIISGTLLNPQLQDSNP